VKFVMNISGPIKLKELLRQAKDRGFLYSNSAMKCRQCKVIFPIEYHKCPQCEMNDLWQSFEIQKVNNFGGKYN